ncbi:MAG: hypothetical protein RLO52_39655 [Sandaracinaceae bacterium]
MEIEEMLAAMKLAEGRALGRAERAAELLTTWLRLEVGELDAGIERRIASASGAELERWAVGLATDGRGGEEIGPLSAPSTGDPEGMDSPVEETLVQEVMHYLSPRVREELAKFEQGLVTPHVERGRAEGRLACGADLLSEVLRLKFGELGLETERRIQSASEVELDRWAERVLTAERLADVFA